MSQSIFPSLPGLSFGITRRAMFNSISKRSVSGIDFRAGLQRYPLYEFTLGYEFLRAAQSYGELQKIIAFFLSMNGSFDSFLYVDPLDNTVSNVQFGIGDGSTTSFQLTRPFTGGLISYVEPVQNLQPNSPTDVQVAGVSVISSVVVDGNGVVTFSSPPGGGQPLTWSGSFYYRCRFSVDDMEPTLFAQDLYSLSKVKFIGAPGNRV